MVNKKTKGTQKFGATVFILGIVIALIAGLLSQIIGEAITISILILFGLIVGFLNITENEVKAYLFSTVSLVIITVLGNNILSGIIYIGPYIGSVLQAITTFVIPAAIIVALKEIYSLAKN